MDLSSSNIDGLMFYRTSIQRVVFFCFVIHQLVAFENKVSQFPALSPQYSSASSQFFQETFFENWTYKLWHWYKKNEKEGGEILDNNKDKICQDNAPESVIAFISSIPWYATSRSVESISVLGMKEQKIINTISIKGK